MVFKLIVETLNSEERTPSSPIVEVVIQKPRSPPYFLGYLLAVKMEDWGGRTLKQFNPEQLKIPDLFSPQTPISRYH